MTTTTPAGPAPAPAPGTPLQYNNGTSRFLNLLLTCCPIFIVMVALYAVLRVRYRNTFEVRRQKEEESLNDPTRTVDLPWHERSPSTIRDGYFIWIYDVWNLSDEEIFRHAGMDATVFIFYLQGCLKYCLLSFPVAAFILIPVYATAAGANKNGAMVDRFIEYFTITTIQQPYTNRLWASVVAAWFFTFAAIEVLSDVYKRTAKFADQFKSTNSVWNYTVVIHDLPTDFRDRKVLFDYMNELFPDQVLSLTIAADTNRLSSLADKLAFHETQLGYGQSFVETTGQRWLLGGRCCGMCGEQYDVIDFHESRIRKVVEAIEYEKKNLVNTPTAFVRFTTLTAAVTCVLVPLQSDRSSFRTEMAGPPPDILWDNLAYTRKDLRLPRLMVAMLTTIMLFFWSIPVGLIQALANLQSVGRLLGFSTTSLSPTTLTWLQGILSVGIFSLWLATLPKVIEILVRYEYHGSRIKATIQETVKYFDCLVAMVLLVTVLSGAVLNTATFIANIRHIFVVLAAGISKVSTFFMLYIIMDLFVWKTLELFRPSYFISEYFGWEDSNVFYYPYAYGHSMLILIICTTYSVIAPFILIVGVMYFGWIYIVYTYQLVTSYVPPYQTGARIYPHIYRRIVTCIYISVMTLLGIFILQLAFAQATLMIILMVVLAVRSGQVDRLYAESFKAATLTSARRCDNSVEQRRALDEQGDFVEQKMFEHEIIEDSEHEYVPEFLRGQLQRLKVSGLRGGNYDGSVTAFPKSPVRKASKEQTETAPLLVN